METGRLDAINDQLVSEREFRLADSDVQFLCTNVEVLFLSEPSVLDVDGRVHVCGDIYGQFTDLLRVFKVTAEAEAAKCLFLGDSVDRGPKSLDVICFLFAMKLRSPLSVFLLRWNHESPEMTEAFGFAEECEVKAEPSGYRLFLDVFDCMPIAAIINGRIFCVHGGLRTELVSIDQIRSRSPSSG
jgi:serine/threonine-protein phosphatase PP1 catalytic subunit